MNEEKPGFGRRRLITIGAASFFGLLVAETLRSREARAGEPSPQAGPQAAPQTGSLAPATACIVLWLNGGPSHLDTFDPKPGTASGGPFKAIKTRAPGIQLSEHLPLLAEQAQHIALVRGMTSREGSHQRGRYLMHTGYAPNPTVVHPAFGSWVSNKLGDPNSDLPEFVAISGPSAGGGILGVQNGPFVVMQAGAPPLNVNHPPGVGDARFERRKAGLEMLEQRFDGETGDIKVDGRRQVYAKAERLMTSPHIKAFDVSSEPAAAQKAYGDSDFGRGCLTARRLLEAGVKYVEVQLDGWDTHKDNFNRTKQLMGQLDPALSALLHDLDQRKMLKNTVVVCLGEFGRTPKINGNEGRDHFPGAWSALLAGGGIRGGYVHGQTNEDGSQVVSGSVVVPNLFATVATQLVLNPDASVMSPIGRPIAMTENGMPIKELVAKA
jgi:uncharacterized protein (DUF1501 family)